LIRDKYFALVKEARAAAKVDIPDAELKKAIDAAESSAQ
jgi:peptidyl-prolyl cis-trans isomerase C